MLLIVELTSIEVDMMVKKNHHDIEMVRILPINH